MCGFAPSRNEGDNQNLGGGTGGCSIRGDGVTASTAKVLPLKRGVENLSELGQKRVIVEHEIAQ
jgi:hypothetical protein